eukprot:TRINITY_DN1766_c0_g1_i1.p1 TRINITY_DN1766_c0_g1~~TRINITY_DN1766_c0_g1_i1.p1  ORF type:complete len:65 (-),score=3.26 TRINITY_DN1766_c0_g1_i1:142-336(-)
MHSTRSCSFTKLCDCQDKNVVFVLFCLLHFRFYLFDFRNQSALSSSIDDLFDPASLIVFESFIR